MEEDGRQSRRDEKHRGMRNTIVHAGDRRPRAILEATEVQSECRERGREEVRG